MAEDDPARLRLDRARRIRRAGDFARVRQTGRRLALGCLIANWQAGFSGGVSRVGVITSKRIGGATVRSRARRLLRECFRLHQHELKQPVELVLVARPSILGKGYAEVEKDFLTTLRKAGLLMLPGER